MSKFFHHLFGWTSVGLFVIVLIMLAVGPRFTTGSGTVDVPNGRSVEIDQVKVTCASVLVVGWPTDSAYLDTTTGIGSSTHDDLPRLPGDDVRIARAGLEQECNERRETAMGYAILFAIPGCLLASAAIAGCCAAQRTEM